MVETATSKPEGYATYKCICNSSAYKYPYKEQRRNITSQSFKSINVTSILILSRVWGSVTNNNGFWIAFIGTYITITVN
jgi:hypothetical protein